MKGFEVDYDRRLKAMIERRTTPVETYNLKAASYQKDSSRTVYNASPIFEIYDRIQFDGPAIKYAIGAMARLDPRYTEITIEQGDRIKNQLSKGFDKAGIKCEFEYQGSVTNDTHIKSYSDIDLLVITRNFWILEHPQVPENRYEGDPTKDLREIRNASCVTLRESFPTAEVDDSGAKAISISGGSLRRKIDVVAANWYNTNRYAQYEAKRFRAVEILDATSGKRIKNMPFLHNHLIREKDERVSGGLRKIIRLMKTLKYDSGRVGLTSYDLTSIGYGMPEEILKTSPGEEIDLLLHLQVYLNTLAANVSLRQKLLVPDESRLVFSDGHANIKGLDELRQEIDDLLEAIAQDTNKSPSTLKAIQLSY